jgi:hypothetical protein
VERAIGNDARMAPASPDWAAAGSGGAGTLPPLS